MSAPARDLRLAAAIRLTRLVCCAVLIVSLIPMTVTAAEPDSDHEDDTVDMLPHSTRAASPDESMAPGQAEFSGNPASVRFCA